MAIPFSTAFNVELYVHKNRLKNPSFCSFLLEAFRPFNHSEYHNTFWGLCTHDYDPARNGGVKDDTIIYEYHVSIKHIDDYMVALAQAAYDEKLNKEGLNVSFTPTDKKGEPHLKVQVSLSVGL